MSAQAAIPYALVALGGGLGSLSRFILAGILSETSLPLGTFCANMLGCALLGLLAGRAPELSHNTWLFLATGFLGGLTTFSTFTLESQTLLETKAFVPFLAYWIGSVVIGLTTLHLFAKLGVNS